MHPAFKQSLKAVGILGLLILGFNVLLMYQISRSGGGTLSADHPDVVVVANVLGGADLQLAQSYTFSGNWSGDIDRGFAARALNLDSQALEDIPFAHRGDQLSAESAAAIRFVTENFGGRDAGWFPTAEQVLTPEYLIRELDVQAESDFIDSSRLLFVRPADQMVFYAWVKF